MGSNLRPAALVLAFLCACAEGPAPPRSAEDRSGGDGERGRSPATARAGATFAPELRARIDAYVAAIAPTSPENVAARSQLLRDWGNAWALAGKALPVDLTLAVHSYRQLVAHGDAPTPGAMRQIDRYLHELALLDADPRALGETRFTSDRPLEAAGWTTIEQVYTAGTRPPRRDAVFVLGAHFMSDHGALQFEDASGDNYVSVTSSRAGAVFEPQRMPWTSMHAGAGRSSALVAYRLGGADLEPGDTVTFVYGDTRRGSRGFRVGTMATERFRLPVYVDLDGGGDFFSPAWASLRVMGEREAASLDVFAPSMVKAGEPVTLAIRAADRWFNRPTGPIPAWEVLVDGERVAAVPAGGEAVAKVGGLLLRAPGAHRFEVRDASGRLAARSNPVWVVAPGKPRIFWGELHAHTDFAEAQGSPEEFFVYGAEDARLDFMALTEHDSWLDAAEWKALQRLTRRTNERGDTIAFLAYEWTAQRPTGGHHNILFRNDDARLVPMVEAPTLPELYRGLRAGGAAADVLVIPHAHTAADWTTSDPELERLVEMYSMHGTFEWFGNAYLREGWELGFVGGSDDHRTKPGLARSSHVETLGQRGGLAAVIAPAKTPGAIFDALRNLSAYATSGVRILLDAQLNGHGMGTRQPEVEERRLVARVAGTAPIDRIDVVKNGEVVLSRDYLAVPLTAHAWVQVGFESSSEVFPAAGDGSGRRRGAPDNPRLYRVWEGTLDVRGAELRAVDSSGVDNRYTERVERDARAPSRLRWHIETRGRRDVVLLELDAATADTVLAFDLGPGREIGVAAGLERPPATDLPPARFTVRLGDLRSGRFEHAIPFDRYVDRVTVQLVDVEAPLDRELEWVDLGARSGAGAEATARAESGDYYYLRVQQLDGARAWSSPWWVGGRGRAGSRSAADAIAPASRRD